MLEQKIEQDIKAALLAGDSWKATALRGLKAEILNLKVELNKRDSGLTDDEVIKVLSKEAKKRNESAQLFKAGGNLVKADLELKELTIIEGYLPPKLSDQEIDNVISEVISTSKANSIADMGKVIGLVKQKTGPNVDGAILANKVKEKLQ